MVLSITDAEPIWWGLMAEYGERGIPLFHSMFSIGSPYSKFAEFSKVYFQNFVIPWKIQPQKLILSAESSRQDTSNGVRFAYVNF